MFIKGFFTCASLVATLFSVAYAAPLKPTQYGDFDRYVLALSWQTGFCQSLHAQGRNEPDECRPQKEPANKADYLTVHGLWPGLPKSIAARGVDDRRWMRFGCATRPIPNMPEAKASQKCAAAETGLSLEVANKLNAVMPGAGSTTCLERYEYAKHGVCFGFDPDDYFGAMVRLDTEIKQSALGQFLAENYGKTVTRDAFNAAVAKAYGDQSVKAVKLTCSGNPAWLTEMQIAIKAGAINAPLAATSLLPQPHPGNCGNSFVIDKAGY
ncbi:ribonuclease I [Kosakonia sp. R1.Fl]|uniref:ribonuclease I n=1 Tax=Kosakonia sp. R1.Fl TaxID=2928706 RepID=UPI00201D6995|nr:ribonuclease I [Kosakonia sp. R1.Fl]MCL6746670.1 ribonuclease I [Kosakonia sp. R1.Fl]